MTRKILIGLFALLALIVYVSLLEEERPIPACHQADGVRIYPDGRREVVSECL